MRVLLVNAFAADDPRRATADVASSILTTGGHDLERIDLVDAGFGRVLTAEERRAYHDEGHNILSDDVAASVNAIRNSEALVFCYPSMAFTVPAQLKAWLERCLLPGVAFGFDAKGRVEPRMTNIRRLAAITTTPHNAVRRARARDAGRLTLLRSLRLNCARGTRRTFVALADGAADLGAIERRLARW